MLLEYTAWLNVTTFWLDTHLSIWLSRITFYYHMYNSALEKQSSSGLVKYVAVKFSYWNHEES